jgi:hypothetical protein
MMSDFDLGNMQVTNSGLDSFLGGNSELVTPSLAPPKQRAGQPRTGRLKVASLSQLNGFIRTAEDTLIHKSDRDLWALKKDARGDFYIERMFDAQGAPLKG